MVIASSCGVHPEQFYRMTLGEIAVVIEGYNERERRSTISRVSAMLRAIGASFGNDKEPYRGLTDDRDESTPVSPKQVRLMRFWRKE